MNNKKWALVLIAIIFCSLIYQKQAASDSKIEADNKYWYNIARDIIDNKTRFNGIVLSHAAKSIDKYQDKKMELEDLEVNPNDKLYEVLYGIDNNGNPSFIQTDEGQYRYNSSLAFKIEMDNNSNTLSNPRYRNGEEQRPLFSNGKLYGGSLINTPRTDLVLFIHSIPSELCRYLYKGKPENEIEAIIPNKFDDDFEIPSFPKTFNNKNVTLKGSWGCIYTPKMLYLYKTIYIR